MPSPLQPSCLIQHNWLRSCHDCKCSQFAGVRDVGLCIFPSDNVSDVQKARELGCKSSEFPPFSALTVTVPGAAAAWEDTLKTFGKLSLKEVSEEDSAV